MRPGPTLVGAGAVCATVAPAASTLSSVATPYHLIVAGEIIRASFWLIREKFNCHQRRGLVRVDPWTRHRASVARQVATALDDVGTSGIGYLCRHRLVGAQ